MIKQVIKKTIDLGDGRTITIDTAPGRGTTMLLRFPTITPPEEDT